MINGFFFEKQLYEVEKKRGEELKEKVRNKKNKLLQGKSVEKYRRRLESFLYDVI